MKHNIVYKTTNLINGNIYVGKHSQDVCPLIFDVYLGSGMVLRNAIIKNGKDNFERITLECVSEDLINEREIYWINKLNSTDINVGYNLTFGGTGGDTFTKNQNKNNTRRKISEKSKSNWANSDYRNKTTKVIKEGLNRPEIKLKRSEALKISQNRPEVKEKISKATKGHKYNIRFEYILKDPLGIIYKMNDLNRFCKDFGLSQSCMAAVCSGIYKQSKGWTCISKKLIKDINN